MNDEGQTVSVVPVPKTGDDSNVLLFAILGILAFAAGLGLFVLRRKKN